MPRSEINIDGDAYVLDARPDRIDHRDRPYRSPLISLPPRWPTSYDIDLALPHFSKMVMDQGKEGACTGFGLAAVINYVLWRDAVLRLPRSERGLLALDLKQVRSPQVSPFQLYHLARLYDEWEGEDYEGSSCRGAVKGFHKHGVCQDQYWPDKSAPLAADRDRWQTDAAGRPLGAYYRIDRLSIGDLQAAIYEVGAVYGSANVHNGWNLDKSPSRLPVIKRANNAAESGCHAFAIVGYEARGLIVQNSWGRKWGYHGFAILPYDDWASSALDAWVAVMGAPTLVDEHDPSRTNDEESEGQFSGTESMTLTLQSYRSDSLTAATTRQPGWFWGSSDAESAVEMSTARLSREEGYGLTVVLENDGRPLARRVGFDSVDQAVHEVAYDLPLRWWNSRGKQFGEPFRVMLYFHGGLNSESDSLDRVQMMAPYFLANGIYPLFITWRTSFLDSIRGILADSLHRFFRPPTRTESIGWGDAIAEQVGEATDRAIEVASQHLLVKPIWSQMKQNAEASISRNRGLYQVIQSLEDLFAKLGGELHVIGHSAGSLPIGHALRRLQTLKRPVTSCRLFAPACTVAFANDYFGRAIEKKILAPESFFIHTLSDELERLDHVGPYGKSLLYLVSRALEINHKEPLLGVQWLWEANVSKIPADFWYIPPSQRKRERVNADVDRWQTRYGKLIPAENINIATEREVDDGVIQIPQTHGSFDNNIQLLNSAIAQIRRTPTMTKVRNLHTS